jgi:hypothetical protein
MPKRLTSASLIRSWLVVLAAHCAGKTDADDLKRPIEIMGEELSYLYPPSSFTSEGAADISMAFQFGFPTMSQLRKELDKRNRAAGTAGEGGTTGKIELSEARLSDGRVAVLEFADRVLLAQYDRRVRQIKAEPDPFWDSEDPDLKVLSKIVNLASSYRMHMPRVWEILALPPHGVDPDPAVQFLLQRTAQAKEQLAERARHAAASKERMNRPPLDSYDDQVNF